MAAASRKARSIFSGVALRTRFYEALAEEDAVCLELSGHCTVQGDRLMLRYTPPGGSIQFTLTQTTAYTELTVDDTGETIPAQHLPRLFERFYRADPSRQHTTGAGTGLGLAITQAIVQAHRGKVRVTSAAGHTCFSIQFPDMRSSSSEIDQGKSVKAQAFQ
jgi:two-component system heavy metal sensor histidine kinase CusS